MSSHSSYKRYRDLIATIEPLSPCIPFIGIYYFLLLLLTVLQGVFLSDLTFIHEGNPTILDDGLINVEKQYLMAEVINKLLNYQENTYCLRSVSKTFSDIHKVPKRCPNFELTSRSSLLSMKTQLINFPWR
jgi:son of sevenless-like protein